MSYLPTPATAPGTPAPETISLAHSSFLQAATYDSAQFALTLDFKSGHQVVHRFVFPVVWAQFKEAKSHGSFYSNSLKKQYPAVVLRKPLLVSELKKAKKKYSHAPN
jgi:hypothetical protein